MKVRRQVPRIIRSWTLKLAPFGASMVLCFLCAGPLLGQGQCPYSVAPGQTQNFSAASSGDNTPVSTTQEQSEGGYYNPSQNRVEAFAFFAVGGLGITTASGFGQINYLFCVSGNPNDTVPATISAQAQWNGDLFSLSSLALPGSPPMPSATVTLTLVDLGANGSASPMTVAAATPLQTQFSPGMIKVISAGGTYVSGSAPVVLNANVTTGHIYSIQYQVVCDAPSNLVSVDVGCDFGSDVFSNASLPNVPLQALSGPFYAQLDSLAVSLGQDLYGTLVAIKANTEGLAAQIAANRQAIAAANLTAEQENAQLLGILKEIESLLSALQPAPAAPPPSKAGGSRRPTNPVRPRVVRRQ